MTEITPGRVAYERFQRMRAAADPMAAVTAWEHPAVKTARPWWEGAAQAASADVAAERDRLREQLGRLLGQFGRGSDGYRARLSGVILAREYRDAGIPVPDRLSHVEGR